jgi:hypothetical protein
MILSEYGNRWNPTWEHDDYSFGSSSDRLTPTFRGADSCVANIAVSPMITATLQYHAGARGLPVALISHVTVYWVVPPKAAIETGIDNSNAAGTDCRRVAEDVVALSAVLGKIERLVFENGN